MMVSMPGSSGCRNLFGSKITSLADYLQQRPTMTRFIDLNFLKPIIVFMLITFFWIMDIVDQRYLIGFLTCLFITCRPIFVAHTIFNELYLYIRFFLNIITKTDQQKKSNNLRFLVIGRSKSGKRLMVESFVQRECAETDSRARGLTSARNINSYGWSVYALVCRCFQGELSETLQSAKALLLKALSYRIHVIIYCFAFSQGLLTDEDKAFIDTLNSALRSKGLKNCTILAMTHGDVFQEKKKENYISFNDWIKDMEPCILKSVLEECSNRCVMFQNKTESYSIKKQQAVELFNMAENIVWENGLIAPASINVKEDYTEKKETFSKEIMLYLNDESEQQTLCLSDVDNQRGKVKVKYEIQDYNNMQIHKINGLHSPASTSLSCSSHNADTTLLYSEKCLFTLGEEQYKMLQPFYCKLKENIRSEDFTDTLFQEQILSYDEKRDIDETSGIVKRKDALFDAIHRHRSKGSVDVFLKVLKEKYTTIYENWNVAHGHAYEALNGHFKTDLHFKPLPWTE